MLTKEIAKYKELKTFELLESDLDSLHLVYRSTDKFR